MAWTLNDFKTRPDRLTHKLQIAIRGFQQNNAPYNENVVVGGDTYSIADFGRNATGTVQIAPMTVPNELHATGTRDNGGNAYLLPWSTNSLCLAELGQAHDFFFTPTVTGCAIIVSGGLCNPFVIHANSKSTRLDSVVTMDDTIAKYREIYGEMIASLSGKGMVDPANVQVFQPGDYISKGTVFGVRKAGAWAFYATAWDAKGATTKKLWPK